MKHARFLCIAIIFLICATSRSEAGGWYGGGGSWHGGGGWHGGYYGGGYYGHGGAVIINPGYYYGAPYPYYYGGYPYNYGYYGTTYYSSNRGSVAVPVQEALASKGYYKGPIDGVVGSGTRAAISAYQQNHGLPVSGTIDTPLLRSLRI